MNVYDIIGLITMIYFQSTLFTYFLYTQKKNVYTQKVIYLNRKFSNINDVATAKMSKFPSFPIHKGSNDYPPEIKREYMDNDIYRDIVNRFVYDIKRIKKMYYFISILFLLVLSSTILFSNFSFIEFFFYLKEELNKPVTYD